MWNVSLQAVEQEEILGPHRDHAQSQCEFLTSLYFCCSILSMQVCMHSKFPDKFKAWNLYDNCSHSSKVYDAKAAAAAISEMSAATAAPAVSQPISRGFAASAVN